MTVFLAGLALGAPLGWWLHAWRHEATETRALDAHLLAVKADVFAESSERLYDELAAEREAVTPELTRLQDKNLRWRQLARRGRALS